MGKGVKWRLFGDVLALFGMFLCKLVEFGRDWGCFRTFFRASRTDVFIFVGVGCRFFTLGYRLM